MDQTTGTNYWFKRRRYGWGWTPVSREGWLVVAGFVAALVIPAILIDDRLEDSGWWLGGWFAWLAICVIGMFVVTRRHAPPGKWRWGTKPDDNPAEDI